MIGAYADLARLHAPLLIALAPLGGAAIAALVPHARLSWGVAVLGSLAASVIALDLAARHLLSGAPLVMADEGVALTLEGVSAFAAPLIVCATALVLLAGGATRESGGSTAPYAWALALCSACGWAGALFAADFAGVFLACEIGWLSSVGVVALSRERGALNGALRMLAGGGAAAALMLLGVGLLGRSFGALDLAVIANGHASAPQLATAGVALVLVALALKAGVAPLHVWSGAVYGRAGGFATLVVGVVGVIGALAVLARISAFATAAPAIGGGASTVLIALGFASVAVGSMQAIGAINLRRLAAYAGASQAGCLLLSLALGSPAGLAAALVQLFALAVALLGLLGGAAATRDATLSALDGLARRAPLAAVAITMGALSFIGAPLTIGFLGRWRLIEAGVGAGWWWAAGAALLSSMAAVLYGGRLIERVYFRRATTTVEANRDYWRALLAPALIVAIVGIVLGVAPALLLRAAASAAALQLGHAL